MKVWLVLFTVMSLVACNSVYYEQNSLDVTQTLYADRGGFSMKRGIKEKMLARGYNVVVGTAESSRGIATDTDNIEIDSAVIPHDVRYIVKVSERREKFNPIWCAFNGFWWWNFNVSVADQKTGQEIMSWRGRGCEDSSLRTLDDILDDMEVKNEQ